MKTRREGFAIVCGNCDHALWTVTGSGAGSVAVYFSCICAQCGHEPDDKARWNLCIYHPDVEYFVGVVGGKKLNIAATHLFCPRCMTENRGRSRKKLGKGWRMISFSGRRRKLNYYAEMILCEKCAQRDNLTQWIKQAQGFASVAVAG